SPRHYTFKVNRKERRAALRSALSVHAGRGSIAVFDPSAFDTPSTKRAAQLLAGSGLAQPLLVILTDEHERAALSFRNLARVSVLPVSMVGVADLIGAAAVVCSQEALDDLTARAKGQVTERERSEAVEA
ncbi:MAG: large subunit ribosomal protein, partial [Solirubrobacteraceae bacterium]|nr:large subunit ribosomal protein [Solirubrobacteraceae bacterium]